MAGSTPMLIEMGRRAAQLLGSFRHSANVAGARGKEMDSSSFALDAQPVDGHVTDDRCPGGGIAHAQSDVGPGVIRRVSGRRHQL